MVLLLCATGSQVPRDSAAALPTIRPPEGDDKGEPVVVPILLSRVHTISQVRVVMPKDLRPQSERLKLWKSLGEVKKRFPKGLVPLDPVVNMNITDESFQKLIKVGDPVPFILVLASALISLRLTFTENRHVGKAHRRMFHH
jgi:ATP-dependent RNA helicase DOB1